MPSKESEEIVAAFPVLPVDIATAGLTVTFLQVLAGEKGVVVNGRVTRDGVGVFIDWPVVVMNPPLRAVTDGGVTIYDPAFALAQVIAGLV